MRKTLAVRSMAIAILGATALTVASCSAGTPSGDDGDAEIRFSIWYGEGDIDVWEDVIAGFEAENPNIHVKFEPLEYSAYWTKLNTGFASNSAPDVVGMQFSAASLGPAGQLLDLGPAVDDELSELPASLVKVGQVDTDGSTATYALPWRFVGASLYANTTALQAAGVELPSEWTLDDFVAAAKETTADGKHGFTIPAGPMQTSLASTFGAAPVSDDGQTATFNTPEMIAYKTWLRDLVYVEGIAPRPADVSTQQSPFVSQDVAMLYEGTWNNAVYREISDFDWDILPNPSGDLPAKNYAGADMISVTAGSKHPEAATKFVEYVIFNKDAQELISTVGAPVLSEVLNDPSYVEGESSLGPANFAYFVSEAEENGAGWAFVPKFSEIVAAEVDADYLILESADSDIPSILADLNTQVQDLLDSDQ